MSYACSKLDSGADIEPEILLRLLSRRYRACFDNCRMSFDGIVRHNSELSFKESRPKKVIAGKVNTDITIYVIQTIFVQK